MKKLFLFCVAFGVTVVSAQKSKNIPLGVVVENPPKAVKDKFAKAHPKINNGTWEMELANYLVDYTDSTNTEYNIVYDKEGNIIRTDKVLDETAYPKPVIDYQAKHYTGETYEVWYSVDSKGNRTYYTKHKLGTSRFDQNGNYVTADSENNQTR